MKRLIYGGISKSDGNYVFDYTYNHPKDIISITPPQLYKSQHGNKIYWFGYEFNKDISSKERFEFIRYIKQIGENKISDRELQNLIELPLKELDNRINLYDIDCFVYPISNRSPLVSKMVRTITRYTSHDTPKLNFELVKSIPTDIEFDWKSFKADTSDDLHAQAQMTKYIEESLLPAINQLDYFSIAKNVKPKYRKYIKNYLRFSDDVIDDFKGLKGKNILVVDDINTSGSTLDEILRIIGKLNHSCSVYIYTLIGN